MILKNVQFHLKKSNLLNILNDTDLSRKFGNKNSKKIIELKTKG